MGQTVRTRKLPERIVEQTSPRFLISFLCQRLASRELFQHEGDDVAVLEPGRRLVATERLGYLDHASEKGPPRLQTGLLLPESFPHETAIERRQCPADVTSEACNGTIRRRKRQRQLWE